MAKTKFTKRFIDGLEYTDKAVIHQDELVNGFAVCTKSASKNYIINKRINGKLQRRVIGDCSIITLQDAREKAMSLISDLMQGKDPFNDDMKDVVVPTLREAYEYYISHKPGLKQSTIATYNRQIPGKLAEWLDRPMNEIMQSNVTEKHFQLTEVSPSQANATFRALNAVWNFARLSFLDNSENLIIKESPVKILTAKRLWNEVKPKTRHLNEDAIGNYVRVLVDFKSEDFHTMQPHSNNARDIMMIYLFTGIRANEGYTLKWELADLNYATIMLTDTKNGDILCLPLGKVMAAMLRHRHYYRQKEPWIFPSRLKECDGNLTDISKQYTNIGKQAGIHITPHDMRRTFSTVADILGLSLSTIKRLMNHRAPKKSDDVTIGYIQVSQRRLRAAMNEIEKFVFNEAGMTQDEVIQKLYTCQDYSI